MPRRSYRPNRDHRQTTEDGDPVSARNEGPEVVRELSFHEVTCYRWRQGIRWNESQADETSQGTESGELAITQDGVRPDLGQDDSPGSSQGEPLSPDVVVVALML